MGVIQQRSLGDDINNFSSTFTSWDQCMEKNICKIPVIVGCVIGGIIIFSILWCLLRCILCGYACCSCCCGGCCGRRHKKEVTTTYVLPPPAAPLVSRPPPPHDPDEPKYAYFDKSPDALPHMPSADGVEVKQRTEVESHEMGPMRRSPSPQMQHCMHSPAPTRPGEIDPMRVQYGTVTDYPGLAPPERVPSAASSHCSNPMAPPRSQPGFAQGYSNSAVGISSYGNGNSRVLLAPQSPQSPYQGGQNTAHRGYHEGVPASPHQYQGPSREEYPAQYTAPGSGDPRNQQIYAEPAYEAPRSQQAYMQPAYEASRYQQAYGDPRDQHAYDDPRNQRRPEEWSSL